jgi:hypothetical protein
MRTHRTLIVGAITVLGLAATTNSPTATLAGSDTQKDGAIPDFSIFPAFGATRISLLSNRRNRVRARC